MRRSVLRTSVVCVSLCLGLALAAFAQERPVTDRSRDLAPAAFAQERPTGDRTRDGVYEITLKSPDIPRKMTVEEIVRDRDLNPGALYRVKTGGYLGFDEAEWVDKIEFKVADRPVTELPQYKKYTELLVEINGKIWSMNETLASYDLLALRLANICDRTRFPTLQSMDENILDQLTVYKQLVLLKSLVVNAMNRFISERSCRDMYSEYSKTLDLYSKQLTELTRNYERLNRRAMQLSQELKGIVPGEQSGRRPEE